MSSASHPIPEFRDADQYWQPIGSSGHEIIRPKPRRPGETSKPTADPGIPPRLPPRDPGGHVALSPVGHQAIKRTTATGSTQALHSPAAQKVAGSANNPRDNVVFANGEVSCKSSCREKHLGPKSGTPLSLTRDMESVLKSTSRGATPLGAKTECSPESNIMPPARPPSSKELAKHIREGPSPRDAKPTLEIASSSLFISNKKNGIGESPSPGGSKLNPNSDGAPSSAPHQTDHGHPRTPNGGPSSIPVRTLGPPSPSNGRLDQVVVSNQKKSLLLSNQPSSDSADYSSLSKSSSDGDPIVLRKRPNSKPKLRRRNIFNFPHHLSMDELRVMQRGQESYSSSSSDENRSSGHASMSDSHASSPSTTDVLGRLRSESEHDNSRSSSSGVSTKNFVRDSHVGHHRGHHLVTNHWDRYVPNQCSPLKVVPENERLTNGCGGGVTLPPRHYGGNRSRLRGVSSMAKDEFALQLEGAAGLDDIRQAIEHLTLRSQGSRGSSTTSTYSSMSGSESEPVRRLIRHSSMETINTNVTNADEFVWVDGHNRLVEFQQLPWTNHDVLRGLQHGRTKEVVVKVSMEVIPRLSYLLQRALVRVAREIQRFSKALGMCGKQEVSSALKVILSPALADSCVKACLRSAAMYAVSGDQFRQSKNARAGLQLSVGRFHRWMCDMALGQFVHEYAAIYLTAAMENLLEEVILQSLIPDSNTQLTAAILEHNVANNADLWGLFQPYAHLNSGRTSTGALALYRWPSHSTDSDSSLLGSSLHLSRGDDQMRPSSKTLEQNLLTTCVGSMAELADLLSRAAQFHLHRPVTGTPSGNRNPFSWSPSSIQTLFYFMRCSQLEHSDHNARDPPQELNYERPYLVLPPLSEWVKVATVHADHRHSQTVDKDDVMQAARLLLPGVDYPFRPFWQEEVTCAQRQVDDDECARRLRIELAFRMLTCGRSDLVPHAMQLLPATRVNTLNERGLSLLMLACLQGDEALVQILLDAGSDVDIEMPPNSASHPHANPETQHWTAVSYATIQNHLPIVKLLLEKGASVEGGTRPGEDKCTVTPLQLASATGDLELVSLLLAYGAHPFLSTNIRDPLSFSGAAQRGCFSALAVAAAHGQRTILHKLLSHPHSGSHRDVLSLEEILAEGAATQATSDRRGANKISVGPTKSDGSPPAAAAAAMELHQIVRLSKTQIKILQEAMYHAAENGHLEITLDLRNIGVPWTLHCWMQTLGTASEQQFDNIIDQLLQDFLHIWPEDCSAKFVDECLPLLFSIFRHTKNEGTSLLLADIFSNCYGKEKIKELHDVSLVGGTRIDPAYVNNPELSDVQFCVEGKVFYAHKIILVNASPRFKTMLSGKCCEGSPPVVQINDIRYDIFQMVMQYLYKGGCENLEVDQNDVLELMASANFFQLDGLLHFCEAKCSTFVDLDSVVSTYIHAKAYNAVQLLEFCQGFLLQNMVALLTYDDSVRRLIFGKKLHNHDVLSGLLLTLQARVKSRNNRNYKAS